MLTKTCINPSCRKENPPDRIHCKFCGWKLPAVASDPSSNTQGIAGTPSQPVALQTVAEPLSSPSTVVRTTSPEFSQPEGITRPQPSEANQQLATEHAALTGAHTALTDAHQQLQQDHQAALTQNHTLSARLSAFEQELARIPGLEQALTFAKEELARVRSKPATEVIKEVPQQVSLLRQVLTWAVPVITALGGMFAGVHTPLNTSKAQLNQTQTQLEQTAQRLNAVLADSRHTKAAKAVLEQQNGQLAGQLATESAQQAQQTQATQSSSAQLAAAQRDLQSTRAILATTTAQLQQADRQRSAAEQRVFQLQAESTRKGSQLDAMQGVIAKHPLLNYHGPTEGNITISYNAKNDKPANITIDHQHISGDGSLSINTMAGTMLPGVPVVVQASGTKRASIVDSPGPGNGWAKLTIRVEGKDQHQAMVHWSVPQ